MQKMKKKTYQVADLPFTAVSSRDFVKEPPAEEIRKRIRQVIRKEAPITEWLLIKRVINSFDIWKAGSSVQAYMKDILDSMDLPRTAEHTGPVYWKKQDDAVSYADYRVFGKDDLACRDVMQVPTAEMANAMAAVLAAKEPLAYKQLVRETAALMGYTRMGTNVRSCMDYAVQYGVKKKIIKEKKDGYVLK